jgi:hypothetical protein
MYGQRKPIAQRTPLFPAKRRRPESNSQVSPPPATTVLDLTSVTSTPAETDAETATETDLDSETALDGIKRPRGRGLNSDPLPGLKSTKSHRPKAVSNHDLHNKYFRRDAILLRNLDIFRCIVTTEFTLFYLPSYQSDGFHVGIDSVLHAHGVLSAPTFLRCGTYTSLRTCACLVYLPLFRTWFVVASAGRAQIPGSTLYEALLLPSQ